mmetsp:Transcript_42568/g.133597  ORF Transcript_42568/g.133597 Transcript_42568/m.133597 type:complete len:815 (-) Transcript_42568:50-2494(-)
MDSAAVDGLASEAGIAFADAYTVTAHLGDGATARVFEAVRRDGGAGAGHDSHCALKLAERSTRAILRRESLLLRQLSGHPHVTRWLGWFASSTAVGLLLELAPGGDCQQLLQRHGAFAESAVRRMFGQLCAALGHLRAHEIVHRDIKLENLLCCDARPDEAPAAVKEGGDPARLVLCDFGHACSVADAREDREFFGTPGYAPPEVTYGPCWSFAADIFSAGVVMYALLANRLPAPPPPGWNVDDGGCGVPDLSMRVLWKVSVEAKLLLLSLLAPDVNERPYLSEVLASGWVSGAAPPHPFVHGPLPRRPFSDTLLDTRASPSRRAADGGPTEQRAAAAAARGAESAALGESRNCAAGSRGLLPPRIVFPPLVAVRAAGAAGPPLAPRPEERGQQRGKELRMGSGSTSPESARGCEGLPFVPALLSQDSALSGGVATDSSDTPFTSAVCTSISLAASSLRSSPLSFFGDPCASSSPSASRPVGSAADALLHAGAAAAACAPPRPHSCQPSATDFTEVPPRCHSAVAGAASGAPPRTSCVCEPSSCLAAAPTPPTRIYSVCSVDWSRWPPRPAYVGFAAAQGHQAGRMGADAAAAAPADTAAAAPAAAAPADTADAAPAAAAPADEDGDEFWKTPPRLQAAVCAAPSAASQAALFLGSPQALSYVGGAKLPRPLPSFEAPAGLHASFGAAGAKSLSCGSLESLAPAADSDSARFVRSLVCHPSTHHRTRARFRTPQARLQMERLARMREAMRRCRLQGKCNDLSAATTVLAEQASAVPEAPPLVNNGGSSSEHGSIDSGAGGGREAFPLREAVRTT